ncbi:hypothetical protein ACFXP7_01145 [Microbacterium sp. P06]|uniref:hypothetical protein n=1 Tax=Microbacterium sp. P06 TaxID=3366949 RepID=UPI00374700ED
MGLFASKPEDPTEWAGLPSEPLRERTEADLLDDPPVAAGILGDTPPGVAWIEIPVVPPADGEPAGDTASDPTD